jgi:hypothetical protein
MVSRAPQDRAFERSNSLRFGGERKLEGPTGPLPNSIGFGWHAKQIAVNGRLAWQAGPTSFWEHNNSRVGLRANLDLTSTQGNA